MDAWSMRDPPPADAAVATVIGAILVAGIAVAGLILYRTTFVPAQEERAEHRFAVEVAERLLEVRSDLERHLDLSGTRLRTTPVPVAQGPSGPLAPPRPPNAIAFDAGDRRATVHAPSARIVGENGTSIAQTQPEWTSFTGPAVENVSSVRDLWVKLDEVGPGREGHEARIRVVDADDAFAGLLRVRLEDRTGGGAGGAPYVVDIRVENATQDPVFDQPIVMLRDAVQDWRFRATDPDLGFDQVLEAADGPVKLVFTQNPLAANHSMTWTETNRSSGAETIHAGGGPIRTVDRGFVGGALRYEARNLHFVDQTYRIDHGAVVLRQGDTAVLRSPPPIEVGRVGDRAVVDLPLPTLTGPRTSLSGRATIAVSTVDVGQEAVRAVAPSASLNLTTDAPAGWSRFWNASLEGALPDDAWTVRSGPDWVNATISGIDPAARDVDLHLRQATIRTLLER